MKYEIYIVKNDHSDWTEPGVTKPKSVVIYTVVI